MSAAADWSYRPALDGLRSLAVYLVVAFHAGVVAFGGGFIGVDLFFVLSGFLVTGVLLSEHRTSGRIRLGRFYARRVRRLLPAAVVAIAATAVAAVFIEPPLTRGGQVGDARAALLYFANWHFVRQATDYFAVEVHTSPFLHFWSLSVEEQFYIAFPLVLIGLLAAARRMARPVVVVAGVGVLAVAGVAAQVWWAGRDPLRAYYGTDARVYQMLAGALLAVIIMLPAMRSRLAGEAGPARRWVAGTVAISAVVALVVAATDALDLPPGRRGLLAAAASLGVIAALEAASGPLTWLLSRPPVVYLGRLSYGTYLWHWPLIVFGNRMLDLSPVAMAVAAGVGATALAALSYVLVESPVRTSPRLAPRAWSVVGCGVAVSALVAVAVAPPILRSDRLPVVRTAGQGVVALPDDPAVEPDTATASPANPSPGNPTPTAPQRPQSSPPGGAATGGTATDSTVDDANDANPPLAAIAVPADLDLEDAAGYTTGMFTCLDNAPEDCILERGTGPHVFLLGDSNAAMLVPMFRQLAAERDFTFSATTAAGCTWQRGLGWEVDDRAMLDTCIATRDDAYDRVLPALQPDLVITIHVPRDDPARPSPRFTSLDESLGSGPAAIAAATSRSLDELEALGATVLLVEPMPYGSFNTLECLSAGAQRVVECAFEASTAPTPTEVVYRYEALARPAVFTLDLDRLVCPDHPLCLPIIDGELAFRDALHVYPPWLVTHRDEIWERIATTGVLDAVDAS